MFQFVWWPGWLGAKPFHKIRPCCRKLRQSQVSYFCKPLIFVLQNLSDWTEILGHPELSSCLEMCTQGVLKYLHTRFCQKYLLTRCFQIFVQQYLHTSWFQFDAYCASFCYQVPLKNLSKQCVTSQAIGLVIIAPTLWQRQARWKRNMFRCHHHHHHHHHQIYRVIFFTGTPQFQYQKENRQAANRDCCSRKYCW